jgi:hypothetical protein
MKNPLKKPTEKTETHYKDCRLYVMERSQEVAKTLTMNWIFWVV